MRADNQQLTVNQTSLREVFQVNNRALITGAVGGLGKAMALACAKRGYDLYLTDLDTVRLDQFSEGIRRQYPVHVICFGCDLSDPASIDRLWAHVTKLGLEFNLLVNVAGLDFEGRFTDIDAGRLNYIVRLNIESVISMTKAVLAHRIPGQRLTIINVSSLAAFNPMPVKAVYAASKRFVLDLSLALGQELAGEDVHVLALCPAGLPTNADCIRGIEAQGLAGRITTLNVSTVARRCLNRALSGRKVYIPGAINWFVSLASALLPRPLVTHLIHRRWLAARASSRIRTA